MTKSNGKDNILKLSIAKIHKKLNILVKDAKRSHDL